MVEEPISSEPTFNTQLILQKYVFDTNKCTCFQNDFGFYQFSTLGLTSNSNVQQLFGC